jgi:hypothetical protein
MFSTVHARAFDTKNWVDEPQADPQQTKWISCWAATPKILARLAEYPAMEGLWIGDGGRKNQPALAALRRLRMLRLNGVVGDDVSFLSGLGELQVLELSSCKAKSLRGLEKLRQLACLVIDHAPSLSSLAEIAGLAALEDLSISTPASWDSSQKCIEVATLQPLTRLSKLRRLTLRGVRPAKGALRPLETLKDLQRVAISHVPDFSVEDFARLAGSLPHASGDCLTPHSRMNFPASCERCGATLEWLTGVTGRGRSLCPACNKEKLAAHVAEFKRIKESVAAG